MNISCDIIKDVLPLYAEDMVSDATREMVDAHLCGCEDCTKELEALKKPQKLPLEVDVSSLKRVGNSIRRRRILAVMAVLLFVATVLTGGALMLDATIYLSAEDAVEDVYVEGDMVKIVWSDQIIGTSGMMEKSDTGNYAVTAWTNLYKILFPVEHVPYEALSDEVKAMVSEEQYALFNNASEYRMEDGFDGTNFWYLDPSENSMVLLLNGGSDSQEAPLADAYFNTAYYAACLVVLCVLCFLLGRLFQNRWYGELAARLSILFGSLAISAVIVTAGEFARLSADITETVVDSTAVSLPMCLFGLCVRQIMKLNRQDKGL